MILRKSLVFELQNGFPLAETDEQLASNEKIAEHVLYMRRCFID